MFAANVRAPSPIGAPLAPIAHTETHTHTLRLPLGPKLPVKTNTLNSREQLGTIFKTNNHNYNNDHNYYNSNNKNSARRRRSNNNSNNNDNWARRALKLS